MAVTTAYTLTEARRMLKIWKDCEEALATGRVKQYTIGTRTLTMIDMEDIQKQIERYANIIEALSGSVRTTKVVRAVPRDL